MGSDKAVLEVGGERLVDRAVRVLGRCCEDVVVASGDGRRLPGLSVPQLADRVTGEGPLAGILPALERAQGGTVAVLAVDVPDADAGVLELCATLRGDAVAAVPVVEGRTQPLHAVWDGGRVDDIARAFDAGQRSPVRLLADLGARLVTEAEWGPVATAGGGFGVSLNAPSDLPGTPP